MDRMIYTALSGMESALTRQRVTASNLANAQTIGFRMENFSVESFALKGPTIEARTVNRGTVYGADMSQGAVINTGNPLDIAIKGEALIALQAEDGTEVYSRRGDLKIGVGGVLENGDGRPVVGEAGPISVPAGYSVSIGSDGTVFGADPAAPADPLQNIGRIKLASVQGSRIEKDLAGFLRVVGGGALPSDEAAQVTSGALEQSNVNTTQVLTEMIEAQRGFERRAKLMITAGKLDEAGARLMSLRS